jgi:uncharacterized protein YjbI with pentapeptide repeats
MPDITQDALTAYLNSKSGLTVNDRALFTVDVGRPKDFTGLDFSYLNCLGGFFLNSSNFTNCKFIRTTLSGATAQGNSTNLTNFTNAYFQYINADSIIPKIPIILYYSNFTNSVIVDCDFSLDLLRNSIYTDCIIKNCIFNYSDFGVVTLRDTNTNPNQSNFTMVNNSFIACNFNTTTFTNMTIYNCNFSYSRFISCIFTNANFVNCSFIGSDFSFRTTTTDTLTFTNCDLQQTHLPARTYITYVNCDLSKTLKY